MRAALLIALVSACSVYNPNLGATPFLCGDSEPRCPDGYSCSADTTGKMVCSEGGGGDDQQGTCNNDNSLEPNESVAQATQTSVETGLMHLILSQLAICPGTDKDTFKIDIATEKDNLDVVLTYDDGNAPLALSILAQNGNSIVNGMSAGANQLMAHAPNLSVGSYFAQVSSPGMQQNNYRLEITTTH
ncbi:MAG TPA: hypothetical protein VGO00_16595 [Kofleriaceae bacterium]|jgi:hypothetical protein|nr:hypothetical protein [Kofleriaceae bacterium]